MIARDAVRVLNSRQRGFNQLIVSIGFSCILAVYLSALVDPMVLAVGRTTGASQASTKGSSNSCGASSSTQQSKLHNHQRPPYSFLHASNSPSRCSFSFAKLFPKFLPHRQHTRSSSRYLACLRTSFGASGKSSNDTKNGVLKLL